jgi:hypothetical protein
MRHRVSFVGFVGGVFGWPLLCVLLIVVGISRPRLSASLLLIILWVCDSGVFILGSAATFYRFMHPQSE